MSGLIDTTGLSLGTGLDWLNGGIGQSGLVISTLSGAAILLGSETSGWAIDFRDMSMVIRDPGASANNYSGTPAGKLLGTTLRTSASGLLLDAADNVYLPTSSFAYSSSQALIVVSCASATNSFNIPVALNFSGNFFAGPGTILRYASASIVTVGGNSSVASSTVSPSLSANQLITWGGCFNTSGTLMAVCNRGGTVTTAATLDWNGTSNRVQLGALQASGAQNLNGTLAWIVYLPRYDTAKLQALTAG